MLDSLSTSKGERETESEREINSEGERKRGRESEGDVERGGEGGFIVFVGQSQLGQARD